MWVQFIRVQLYTHFCHNNSTVHSISRGEGSLSLLPELLQDDDLSPVYIIHGISTAYIFVASIHASAVCEHASHMHLCTKYFD